MSCPVETRTWIMTMIFSVSSLANAERQIEFLSSKDGVTLKGALAMPNKLKGAVLLLVGSGRTDRDETVSASQTASGKTEKLFKQLSDTLVKREFATLRYDKRGVLDSTGKVDMGIWKTADREHLISDAVDAAKFLSLKTGVSLSQLIILGHSEGTIISVETAIAVGGKVRALLLFGAQARSMKEMLHFQLVEAQLTEKSSTYDRGKLEKQFQEACQFIETTHEDLAPDGKPINWYRQFLAAPANQKRALLVQGKFVFFQGESDRQTPFGEIQRFVDAGLKNALVFKYPGLGHGFSRELGGRPTLGPIDSKVTDDLQQVLDCI